MGEGYPSPILHVERSVQPSPTIRAFTPVFDGLWGEGTTMGAAERHLFRLDARRPDDLAEFLDAVLLQRGELLRPVGDDRHVAVFDLGACVRSVDGLAHL